MAMSNLHPNSKRSKGKARRRERRQRKLKQKQVVENGQKGQGLAEYTLILALIAVISIAALIFLGTQISTVLSSIGVQINK